MKRRSFSRWLWLIIPLFIAWFIPWVFVLYTGVLIYFPYEADGVSRYMRLTGPLPGYIFEKNWSSKEQIPQACKRALIASEDGNFYEHIGVDFDSLQKAYERNSKRKKVRVGGSTITQQLVKNAFLHRKKSYIRKAREGVGALFLDLIMSKSTQMAWYFNVVEFGPNVYGINHAAEYYFHKKTAQLSRLQCAELVAILPSPRRFGKHLKSGSIPAYLQRRIDRILHKI